MFSLRYLVVVFYRGDWKCGEVVEEFSNIKSQLASNGADVVCVSSDSTQTHSAWIKADKWINLSVSARSSSLYLQEQGRLGGQSGYSTVERSHWRIGQLLRSLSSRGETLPRKIAVCISLQIKLMNIFSLICLFQLCRDFLSSISSGMPINFWRMTIRLLVSLEKPVMGHETSHWSRSTSHTRFFLFCLQVYQRLFWDGFVIIDDAGLTRQVMTTTLDSKEVATSVFGMVPVFKRHRVSFISHRIFSWKLNCEAKTLNNLEFVKVIKVIFYISGWHEGYPGCIYGNPNLRIKGFQL